MAYRPKISHLIKIIFGKHDSSAAQGLFMEGKIEYDSGNTEDAKLMFFYGRKLDPEFAGNFYNYAVAVEKKEGQSAHSLRAWQEYVKVARRDSRQSKQVIQSVLEHIEKTSPGKKT